jgi:hypothetical protein
MTAIAAIVLVGLAVALFAALDHGSSEAQAGCLEVPAAHSVGGATYEVCGGDVARWCRSAATRDDWLGSSLQSRCRRAGYR